MNNKVNKSTDRRSALLPLLVCAGLMAGGLALSGVAPVHAQGADESRQGTAADYRVRTGDRLTVSVWREDELQRELLVQPDGRISFPLAGQVQAAGNTIEEIRDEITSRLSRYIPDLVVTVTLDEIRGTRVYVLGQVNNSGQYAVDGDVDVMQALSMAGGMTAFASANDIRILRRNGTSQQALQFRYNDVARGRNLEQNILLQDGDVVVVP